MSRKKHKSHPTQHTLLNVSQNRDPVRITRRSRHFGDRRDFVPQDDLRRKFPSEDFFGPIPDRVIHTPDGAPTDIISKPIQSNRRNVPASDGRRTPIRHVFENLRNTICYRRKVRRQVLFAKRKTGKGSRKQRHSWNVFSNVLCRH